MQAGVLESRAHRTGKFAEAVDRALLRYDCQGNEAYDLTANRQ